MLLRELVIYARDFKEVNDVFGNALGAVFNSKHKEEYNNF